MEPVSAWSYTLPRLQSFKLSPSKADTSRRDQHVELFSAVLHDNSFNYLPVHLSAMLARSWSLLYLIIIIIIILTSFYSAPSTRQTHLKKWTLGVSFASYFSWLDKFQRRLCRLGTYLFASCRSGRKREFGRCRAQSVVSIQFFSLIRTPY